MANVIEFRITGKDYFTPAMKGVSTSLGKVRGQMNKMVQGATSLKGAVISLAAAVGVKQLAGSFIDAASTTEQLQTRLGVLLGSVDEGNRLFQDMSKYASEVPFQYEEIMQSATTLAGVMKGGVDEINQWMPMIGDLAAVSGLSIQQTTEQIVRMYSAGAASADLFRERGITAMLGFQAGVSYTAEETRTMLMQAFEDPASKFAGATAELATTWEGLLSMMGDKWFQFRNTIMQAGLFDYIKAIASVLNDTLGKALSNTGTLAEDMGRGFITVFEVMMGGIGNLMDAWRGWEILVGKGKLIYMEMGLAFGQVVNAMRKGIESLTNFFVDMFNEILNGWNWVMDKIGGEQVDLFQNVDFNTEKYDDALFELQDMVFDARIALADLAHADMPSEAIDEFLTDVYFKFDELRMMSAATRDAVSADMGQAFAPSADTDTITDQMQSRYERLSEALLSEQELMASNYEENLFLLEDAYNNELVSYETYQLQKMALQTQYEKSEAKQRQKHLKAQYQVNNAAWTAEQNMAAGAMNQILGEGARYSKSMFALNKAAGIGQAIMSTYQGAAKALEWGWPMGPVFAAAIVASGLAQVAQIKAQSFSGQADNGMDFVPYAGTYMLSRGERIVSPEQNRDLTEAISGGGFSTPLSIENIQIDVLPNATSADALLNMTDEQMVDIVNDKIISALDTLARRGIKPVYTG